MYKIYTKWFCTPSGYGAKQRIIMRVNLIAILFIVFLMQVSANSLAQKVTLNYKEASLKEVFNDLKKQTGYKFLYTHEMLSEARKVTITITDAPLREVLADIFSKQPLSFSIEDNSVVLKRKTLSLIDRLSSFFKQDSLLFKGKVLDEKGSPLPGATIKLKGGTKASVSTGTGYFERYGTLKSTLVVSYLGYLTQEISLNGKDPDRLIIIQLSPGQNQLGEVSIVSTGYQDLPKERATGSFELITKEQLQHSTSPNLLRRLEGITTSLDFRNDLTPTSPTKQTGINAKPLLSKLTIRGKNSLSTAAVAVTGQANTSGYPLVVIDGIASVDPLDIERLNPNDVENITILKDAAAASIWGSRAANGVIVIKTKQSGFNRPARISFSSNIDITEKINLFYKKQMTVSDYIDAQKYAFPFDYPDPVGAPDLIQAQPMMSPVAEILNSQRNGAITIAEANAQLDALRGNDIRRDLTKYVLQNAVTQSYDLGVDGGTPKVAYRLSAGYNKSIAGAVGTESNRFNLAYNVTLKPLKKLTITAIANYSKQNTTAPGTNEILDLGSAVAAPFYPYTRLADDQGNPAIVPNLYRPAFLDLLESTYGDKILNLRFKPLENIQEGYSKTTSYALKFNTTAGYQFSKDLSVNVTYSYNKIWSNNNGLDRQNSFVMRNMIDQFTDPTTLERHIPLGGHYTPQSTESDNQTFRGLLNYNKSWNNKHDISAIAGVDVAQSRALNRTDEYYGYNEDKLTPGHPLDPSYFNLLFADQDGTAGASIPLIDNGYYKTISRAYSLFSNIAYTYNKRYTISGSIRKDASSAFGIGTNRTGKPFYSAGLAWSINNENFYNLSWLPALKLRATYGYNGNTNPAATTNPLLQYSDFKEKNQLYYAFLVPNFVTNRELRPERTGVFNLGLDFGLKNSRITGSIEYYDKQTKDLLTSNLTDPTLGYNHLTFNTGNLHGYGMDMTLNSNNLTAGRFNWTSSFLLSYNRVKVSKLYVSTPQTAGYAVGGGGNFYTEGYDLNRLFAWKWAGLDPATGDPRVYLNGKAVTINGTDLNAINALNDAPISELHYMGSAVPVYFGSLRNTFTYGPFALSVNLLYKLGYYAIRPQSDLALYSSLFGEFGHNTLLGAEYANRWQKPGDEAFTNVPSLVYSPGNSTRDGFYQNSDINVYKADHIRLQEINFSYALGKSKWVLKNPRVFANVNNLGIVWRANKLALDPDIYDYPVPRTYSFGFSANF